MPRSQAVCNLEYGLLNQPVTTYIVLETYNSRINIEQSSFQMTVESNYMIVIAMLR